VSTGCIRGRRRAEKERERTFLKRDSRTGADTPPYPRIFCLFPSLFLQLSLTRPLAYARAPFLFPFLSLPPSFSFSHASSTSRLLSHTSALTPTRARKKHNDGVKYIWRTVVDLDLSWSLDYDEYKCSLYRNKIKFFKCIIFLKCGICHKAKLWINFVCLLYMYIYIYIYIYICTHTIRSRFTDTFVIFFFYMSTLTSLLLLLFCILFTLLILFISYELLSYLYIDLKIFHDLF